MTTRRDALKALGGLAALTALPALPGLALAKGPETDRRLVFVFLRGRAALMGRQLESGGAV